MDLRDYLATARKNWLLIAAITVVCVGLAFVYVSQQSPKYSSSAVVFVSSQAGSSLADVSQGSTFTMSRVQTYTHLATTPSVLEPAIRDLGLSTTASSLAGSVSATNPTNTTLISVTVSDRHALQAKDIANAVAQSLSTVVERIETPIGVSKSPVRLTVVQPATAASSPSSPKKTEDVILALILGLALGFGAAALRFVLDTRVSSERDLNEILDVPVIGRIPVDPTAGDKPLATRDNRRSTRVEAFRALRTNLEFVGVGAKRSFVVTSSLGSEGKSSTSLNLAFALADSGKKVALVDADLRKPRLAQYLRLSGVVGLSDVLIGATELDSVIRQTTERGPSVLAAGSIPPNPSELLGSEAMRDLISTLEQQYDVVILDTPPVLPVTDAVILATLTGGALVVVRAGRTTRHQVAATVNALDQVGAKTLGLILSMIPTKGPEAYRYDYYEYSASEPARRDGANQIDLVTDSPSASDAEQP